ncbi:MAG: hypothetical protein ACIAXF_03810, partial [Phycisphaerales bacterium JB063]
VVATARGSQLYQQADSDEMRDEIEHFSRLILQYPYWKGEELRTTHHRTLYQDFFTVHGSAAGYFIETFAHDYDKLSSIRIVHHENEIRRRKEYMDAALDVAGAEHALAGNLDHLLDLPEPESTQAESVPDPVPLAQSSDPVITQSEGGSGMGLWIGIGAILAALLAGFVFWIKCRSQKG